MKDGRRSQLDGQEYTYSCTLGPRITQNPYVAELVAMAEGLSRMGPAVRSQEIRVFTRNLAAALAVSQPRSQSGQSVIDQIYRETKRLRGSSNQVTLIWTPATTECTMAQQAKMAARASTEPDRVPTGSLKSAKSTLISVRKAVTKSKGNNFGTDVGRFTRELDVALPGPHTRAIYDTVGRNGSSVLAQLRTGMARLNGYLHRIGATERDRCVCGHEKETVEHFLFRCSRWDTHRLEMLEQTETNRSNLSFHLGGKARADTKEWKPNMEAIKATVKYAIYTGRLDTDMRD